MIIIISSNNRTAATIYSLGTLFVSEIYVHIPCIKEIMMIIIINSNNRTAATMYSLWTLYVSGIYV
jgi:hypothetical protein